MSNYTDRCDLVLITWDDSHHGSGWKWLDEIMAKNEQCLCFSVGWMAARSKTHTTLIPHVSCGEGLRTQGLGEMTIPNRAIVSVKILKRKAKR